MRLIKFQALVLLLFLQKQSVLNQKTNSPNTYLLILDEVLIPLWVPTPSALHAPIAPLGLCIVTQALSHTYKGMGRSKPEKEKVRGPFSSPAEVIAHTYHEKSSILYAS